MQPVSNRAGVKSRRETVPVACIRLSKRGRSWSRECTRVTCLVGYTSATSVANSAGGSRRLATIDKLLVLTDTKSTTANDEHRSRGLYSVVGCPQPLSRLGLGTVMFVVQQEGLLRGIWRLEHWVSFESCMRQGELTPGPIDRLGDQMFIGAGRCEPNA